MIIEEFKEKINLYAAAGVAFIFLIDFEMKRPLICPLIDADKNNLIFYVNGLTNYERSDVSKKLTHFKLSPMNRAKYDRKFKFVKRHILRGNSYLLNLTFPTPIETNCTLEELFCIAKAPYKLLFKNDLLVFSPECFVKIMNGHIFSYPMKGTIDASIPDAENIILNNKKEFYEHNTIVDLIRNDLSMVSENIQVTRFRYLEHLRTNHNELLQVSSEIRGTLPPNWRSRLGDMLLKLLPAGSVSGAPKQRTVEIIRQAENQDRGYYTGIFGIFDGNNLDSAVNIRYIEHSNKGLRFRSGGGITAFSDKECEYNEMLNKVYVPTL